MTIMLIKMLKQQVIRLKDKTLQFVDLNLRTPVFSHGMLYVALSNL